jgi:hypothetical protein
VKKIEKQVFEKLHEENLRKKQIRASLVGEEKKLIDLIDSVKCEDEYSMKTSELVFLIRLHENNLAEGAYDIFRYGYLKGVIATEKKSR